MENKEALKFNKIGTELMNKENYEKALEFFLKSISLDPNNPVYYHNAGVCLMIEEKNERAITLFKEALNKGIEIDETIYYLSNLLYDSKKFEELINLEINIKNSSYIYEISIRKAKALITVGRLQESIKLLHQLRVNGFSTQELDLIENMIKNNY
ncbi:MAG: tetratricopeptide repeat protein [Thermotogota bacterium]